MTLSRRTNQTGSAILATILLATMIGLMGIGIARFSLTDFRLATSLEDSAIAFAAAEAGIEEGLLRVRFNRNVEVPVVDMQESTHQAERVNLTTGALLAAQIASGSGPYVPNEQIYELRVWYKQPQIGSGNSADLSRSDYPYRLYKDQTIELDVSNVRGQNLIFVYQAPTGVVARIESRVIQEGCGANDAFCETNKQFSDLAINHPGITLPIPAGGSGALRLRIKPYLFVAGTQTPASPSSYVAYHIRPQISTSILDAGITYIESTGYYGSSRRTLLAKVERRTGTVLGVYDYALFAADIPPVP